MVEYFQIIDDLDIAGRWFLRLPRSAADPAFDARVLTRGRSIVAAPNDLACDLRTPGSILDFTLADFGVPVLTRRAVEVLLPLAEDVLQRVPVAIAGHSGLQFEAVNAIAAAASMDEGSSLFTRWEEKHGRPDKVGKLRVVTKIVLDPSTLPAAPVFRLAGWAIALLVNARVAAALASAAISGIKLRPVPIASVH